MPPTASSPFLARAASSSHVGQQASDVGRCIPPHSIPVNVARQCVGEPIAVLVKLRPRIDGRVNVSGPTVLLRGVAGFDPQTLDGQWRPLVGIPRGSVGWTSRSMCSSVAMSASRSSSTVTSRVR